MSKRINFGQIKEVIQPPNLIENQINSFKEFLQMDVPPNQRESVGLRPCFLKFSRSKATIVAAISSMSAIHHTAT